MRRLLVVTAILVLASGYAQTTLAQSLIGADPGATGSGLQAGTVGVLDTVSMNFICQTNRLARQYWVTRGTRFVAGRRKASFFELRTGLPVQVISHDGGGGLAIADLVVF
jgi:hypothetical protein